MHNIVQYNVVSILKIATAMDGRTTLEPSGWEAMDKRFNTPAAELAPPARMHRARIGASSLNKVHIIF